MNTGSRLKFLVKCSALTAAIGVLLIAFSPLRAETNPAMAHKPLDLSLPEHYTSPPEEGKTATLSFVRNPYTGSLSGIQATKNYALGLKRLKIDKSMRVRGWEMTDNFYLGQTRIGNQWGVGMLKTQGNFAYGLNNKGVGMTYNAENAVYRINLQEVALEIDF